MKSDNALADLQKRIEAEQGDSALAQMATQLVMGDGPSDADILFVGEAPGKQEDIQGLPFVGASGKFLNEMLKAAHLSRKDVYITNIVKYRPPDNRDPLTEEKRQFLPYLLEQIDIIKPRVVLTLGRHSGMCFISKLQLSRDHGVPHDVTVDAHTLTVIPLYHPAAALYNGSMRQVLIDDFIASIQYIRS